MVWFRWRPIDEAILKHLPQLRGQCCLCMRVTVGRIVFDGFLIDKTDAGRYTINDLGRDALNGGNQTLDDIDADPAADDADSSDDDPADPWDETPLNRGQFIVLQAIADESGHPRTVNLLDAYADAGFEASSSAVSARLKDLFDQDFVDRTPARPYRYWITDDGEALLE